MPSLIAMCCYDTEQNGKTKYTIKTARGILNALHNTSNYQDKKFIIVDNGSCAATQEFLNHVELSNMWSNTKVIRLSKNIGTAEAINLAWKERPEGWHGIKIDNDTVIHCNDWIEQMEEVVAIDPTIGQVGLKRNDLWENVYHDAPFYRTTIRQLPHKVGERWIIVEESNHIIGTCVLHSAALLNKVGFMKQPSTYGLDDTLMSKRSQIAGFKNVFLPHIPIDHLDNAPPKEWQDEKDEVVRQSWAEYSRLCKEYEENPSSIYYNPFQ